ncbi:OmpA family protein [uncultured Cohaesibacter sp.]|uniref:OmpA family protein n=1 Tax=uncultured Cohaesibacter sp. TaxID=1002546 RepID=UPI00293187DE|nr:OmpA family protein [uncultured Cohaesibacter sp.]
MSFVNSWLIPGVVAVAAVTGITLFSESSKIEADLTERAQKILDAKDMDWAEISFDGRDGTLLGTEPEEGEAKWAIELLNEEWGIRKVDDKTVALPTQKPFTWGLRRDGDAMTMIGYLPYRLFKSAPGKIAADTGDVALDMSSVAAKRGAPREMEHVFDLSTSLMSKLPSGSAMLQDDKLTISGKLDNDAASAALFDEITKELTQADLQTVSVDLQIPQPQVPVEPSPVDLTTTPKEDKLVDGFAVKRSDEGVDLSGAVPSDDVKQQIVDLARRKFGYAAVKDRLIVKPGSKIAGLVAEDYDKLSLAVLQLVSRLSSGEAKLTSEGLTLTGGAYYEGALTQLQTSLQDALPAGLSLKSDLSVAAPGEVVEADQCQMLLRTSLEQNNIFFDSGNASISADSFGLLDSLIYTATRCPGSHIQIRGHTDSDGDDAANMLLSEKRAQSVLAYLVSGGLAEDRLQARGFGESEPVASNDTPEGKAKNRRIEFTIQP